MFSVSQSRKTPREDKEHTENNKMLHFVKQHVAPSVTTVSQLQGCDE